MNKNKLSGLTRAITGLSAIAMILVIFLPIWKIELSAPQYPEGLTLRIYANRIGGDVDIVNGLNHYIGMRTLHTRDFVEFVALPYIIGGFLVLGFLVALVNRRALFYGWFLLFLLIAFTSLVDFYRWEYNYGHNLDEGAPIKVPGMAYQPPLIGYKQLLNFSAYSIPDSGGWVFAGVGVLLAMAAFLEFRKNMAKKRSLSGGSAILGLLAICLSATACHHGPVPIWYGQDNCDQCKMQISDKRFGFELLTQKGKVYKFDDMHCLLEFIQSDAAAKKEIAGIYFADFSADGQWIPAGESFLLKSPALHSPMNGDIAAFRSADSMNKYKNELNGEALSWKDIYR